MRRRFLPLAAAAVTAAAAITGCGPPRIPAATLLTADPAQLAVLDRGRAVYLVRCGGCHALHEPRSIAPAQWPEEIADMRERAKLSPTDEEPLTAYLQAAAAWVPPVQ